MESVFDIGYLAFDLIAGILMIPKTCAYIWIIVMGLQLLF